MPCDICGDQADLTRIPAQTMRLAAQTGFNPITEHLLPTRLTQLVNSDSAAEWKQQTLYGHLSDHDWKLCHLCSTAFNARHRIRYS